MSGALEEHPGAGVMGMNPGVWEMTEGSSYSKTGSLLKILSRGMKLSALLY